MPANPPGETVGRETASLARHLLCAVPQLQDPNFRRSVVLMLEHNEEGAHGLVLNHELPTEVAEVADALGFSWAGAQGTKIRLGGPVEPMRGWVLHDEQAWDPNSRMVATGVHLTTSLDGCDEDLPVGSGRRFAFLLGYAGWGPGQLEAEMAAGSWVAVPIVPDDAARAGVAPSWVFEADVEQMWTEALRSIGVDPARLVGLNGGSLGLH